MSQKRRISYAITLRAFALHTVPMFFEDKKEGA